MSDMAAKKIINELTKLKSIDHDYVEVITNSIMNGWSGVFPLKKNNYNTNDKPNYKPTETKSTVKEWGRGHPDWDRLNGF
jgi:hypothetical protein